MNLLTAFLLLAATMAQSPVAIGYLNANGLMEKCESGSAPMLSYCFAYIAGVNDTAKAYESWLNMREYCLPPATPQGDLRRIFVEYLKANPGHGAGEAASVIIVALKEKYPCDT
ncbi:Rap1a/Tai family immunity protein [Sphingobium yanoikuyae]|uniref:Rap1a immunity protein domain-containing protein n=2 Tax=Sphingobium yanoikuyae TaxID=13690 RepID=A0A9X7YFB8_SPHYA|nr:Rap1a/Tai family immunity protein [Sphingobium yanoikuyae]QNG48505.1 hypothetical protein H3V42_13830 [Sphingobium yanoikuyae]